MGKVLDAVHPSNFNLAPRRINIGNQIVKGIFLGDKQIYPPIYTVSEYCYSTYFPEYFIINLYVSYSHYYRGGTYNKGYEDLYITFDGANTGDDIFYSLQHDVGFCPNIPIKIYEWSGGPGGQADGTYIKYLNLSHRNIHIREDFNNMEDSHYMKWGYDPDIHNDTYNCGVIDYNGIRFFIYFTTAHFEGDALGNNPHYENFYFWSPQGAHISYGHTGCQLIPTYGKSCLAIPLTQTVSGAQNLNTNNGIKYYCAPYAFSITYETSSNTYTTVNVPSTNNGTTSFGYILNNILYLKDPKIPTIPQNSYFLNISSGASVTNGGFCLSAYFNDKTVSVLPNYYANLTNGNSNCINLFDYGVKANKLTTLRYEIQDKQIFHSGRNSWHYDDHWTFYNNFDDPVSQYIGLPDSNINYIYTDNFGYNNQFNLSFWYNEAGYQSSQDYINDYKTWCFDKWQRYYKNGSVYTINGMEVWYSQHEFALLRNGVNYDILVANSLNYSIGNNYCPFESLLDENYSEIYYDKSPTGDYELILVAVE